MAVSLKANFDANQIRQYLLQQQATIEAKVLSALQQVGETFITDARNNNTYKDQTGNLRGSIGYVILKNGVQIFGGFPGNNEGTVIGEQLAEEISTQYPTGFVLIVVAGMDYAAAVESKGYDVLTGSSKLAINGLRKAIERISKKRG